MDRAGFNDLLWTWIRGLIERVDRRPVLVGFSAPQGAGKTAITRVLCRHAAAERYRAVGISIDDFYLGRAEQMALARRYPGNRFLSQRGYPGTHDVALGARVLASLGALGADEELAVPSYDRSAFGGKGDRRPADAWPRVSGPLDLVVFEGWMLGFRPVAEGSLVEPALREPNRHLAAYAAWTAMLDAFVWLEPTDPAVVVDWRAEAEADARNRAPGGMTDAEVRAFAEGFLPAYATWLPTLRAAPAVAGPVLHLVIGRDRLPVGEAPDAGNPAGRA